MKCPQCNAEIAENSKFCPECGAKLSESTANTATLSENEVQADPNIEKSNETKSKSTKQKKKKTIKGLIIVASILILCGLIVLALYFINPNCIFGHGEVSTIITPPTCTVWGSEKIKCKDCGKITYFREFESEGHKYGDIVCGKETPCTVCGEKKIFEHNTSRGYCTYCGEYEYTIILPTAPITVHDYDSRDNIESTIVITDLTISGTEVSYTIKRTYHEDGNNMSERGCFSWKLYSPDGTVLVSDTEYTNASIKVGEQCKGSFEIYVSLYDVPKWTDCKLEILNIK